MSHNADRAAFLALLQPFDVDSAAVDTDFDVDVTKSKYFDGTTNVLNSFMNVQQSN